MKNRSKLRSESRIGSTGEYLKLAQQDIDTARRTRLHYIHLGRTHGMTYQEIGDALGVSGVAARRLAQRNPEVM